MSSGKEHKPKHRVTIDKQLRRSAIDRANDVSASISKHRISSIPQKNTVIDTEAVRSLIHDANQHITTILGGAEIAHERVENQEDLFEILEIIKVSATRLIEMLNLFKKQNFISPPTQSQLETKENLISRINISELIRSQIEPQQFLYPQIQFELDTPAGLMVIGYQNDIHRILENMFINARNSLEMANPVNPYIYVVVKIDNINAHIIMRDNGTGVPVEYREKIFDKGFSTKTKSNENGIGLYYSKKRAKSINGDLKLFDNSESSNPLAETSDKQGATAILTLPLAKIPPVK